MTTNFKFLILVIKQLNNKNGNRLQKCHYFFFKLMILWSDAIISRMTSMFTEVRMSCKDSIRTLVLGSEVSKKPPNLSLENDCCAWIAERSSHSTTINIGTLCPGPWGRSLVTTILFRLKHNIYARKTFRKNGVKRKQKEQLLILLFVNLLLHLCCLWKLLKITKMENKII